MIERYIYVCYEIKARDDNNDTWTVSFQDNMESFTTMKKAVEFCRDNYAKYFIAVEKCDAEVYNSVLDCEK